MSFHLESGRDTLGCACLVVVHIQRDAMSYSELVHRYFHSGILARKLHLLETALHGWPPGMVIGAYCETRATIVKLSTNSLILSDH